MQYLDKLGWPVERVKRRCFLNFIRLLIHTRKIKRGSFVTQAETPEPPKDGTYIHGGSIYTIKRLDDNDDWVTASNGGRYKYRVDCSNCGECWHVSDDECYMVSESWEKMKAQWPNNRMEPTG